MKFKDLLNGFIRLHILYHTVEHEIYDQWIIDELARHGYKLSFGTLYPLRNGMEQRGYRSCASNARSAWPANSTRPRLSARKVSLWPRFGSRSSPAIRSRPSRSGTALHLRSLSGDGRHPEPHGVVGAGLGLIGIFLPGVLVLLGTLPFWDSFRKRAGAQSMMRVSKPPSWAWLLGAALYDPVWTSSVHTPQDFGIALVGFVLLTAWRAPPLLVVMFSAAAGVAGSIF